MHADRDTRLLEPGWGGYLEADEVAYIIGELRRDRVLRFAWGFRPSQKRFPEVTIRRIADAGDPASRAVNIALARPRRGRHYGAEAGVSKAGSEREGREPMSDTTTPQLALSLDSEKRRQADDARTRGWEARRWSLCALHRGARGRRMSETRG